MRIAKRRSRATLVMATVTVTTLVPAPHTRAANRELRVGSFAIEHTLVLPGTPETLYDALTGDISGWWDHTFSERPAKFYIEAKPGGGFWEISMPRATA